ncbi:flavin-containing monooxygenase [Streptosporangium lutulentum]
MTVTGRFASPDGTAIDKESLRQRYLEERNKRLRPDGNDQYLRLTGHLAHYLDDPHTPMTPREPKTDHVTVAFIGGGFAGLVTGARLKEAASTTSASSRREAASAAPGTGTATPARSATRRRSCTCRSLRKPVTCRPRSTRTHPRSSNTRRRIGKQFGLYDDALFHTEVKDLRWDEERSRWIIRTNRGDDFTARFVAMGTGPLHVPKLPGIPGIQSFKGHSFHTSRWDYDYTGGDPSGAPMEKLASKRVAVIGTGATAVQCVPHLARACEELYVFQRTPSSVDVRNNQPTDFEWFAQIATPGWQQRWLENFTANQTNSMADEDLVMDGWTDIARRLRSKVMKLAPEDFTPEKMMEAFEESDFEKMEEIRARVDSIVEDPETARNLKAWYRQLCKRPCFHDEYLQAYNVPGTHLVDTDGKGVERITENGVVVAAGSTRSTASSTPPASRSAPNTRDGPATT